MKDFHDFLNNIRTNLKKKHEIKDIIFPLKILDAFKHPVNR